MRKISAGHALAITRVAQLLMTVDIGGRHHETALSVKDKGMLGPRFLVGMRGLWPDERVDGEIWRRNSLPYRIFRCLERTLLLAADTVVSLTRAGVREMEKFDYLAASRPRFEVIPTCTNLGLFKQADKPPTEGFTLGYVGSVGSWYMFDEVAKAVGILFRMHPDVRFLVINQYDHDAIRETMRRAGVPLDRVEIRAAEYRDVSRQIELSPQLDIGARCRAAAEARFSPTRGAERYKRNYQELVRSDAAANGAKPAAAQSK